ncbi:hypothetical protein [Fodinicola feengrottensis]|uniref:hypothetical protein n=1 Tax=Fodinicola feengrottensis TaxID=435914 RepID=UPI0024415D1F|nr:hypothetical protein [Fodinicola feengrottensis]
MVEHEVPVVLQARSVGGLAGGVAGPQGLAVVPVEDQVSVGLVDQVGGPAILIEDPAARRRPKPAASTGLAPDPGRRTRLARSPAIRPSRPPPRNH